MLYKITTWKKRIETKGIISQFKIENQRNFLPILQDTSSSNTIYNHKF